MVLALFILLFAIIALVACKYIYFVIKRSRLLFKLKKANAKVTGTHKFWFLGTRGGEKCDFYVETEKEILSVKLFNCDDHRFSKLVLTDDRHFFFRKRAVFVSMSPGASDVYDDGRRMSRPDYDFNYRPRVEWKDKAMKNVLLVNPTCREIIRKTERGDEIILGAGDVINNMTVMSLSSLIKYIDSQT